MTIYVYDIEIINNALIIVFYNIKTEEFTVFEYSIFMDQRIELKKFVEEQRGKFCLVGYNNYGFDDQLLYYVLTNMTKSVQAYKKFANEIINSPFNKFRDYEIYPKWITLCMDTMVINNYGIMGAKTTSLKMLGFNFREADIEDLPIKHDSNVKSRVKLNELIEYCKKDCLKTFKHYIITKPLTKYRYEFGKKFGFGTKLINTTEVQFSKKVLTDLFAKKMNLTDQEFMNLGTYHKEIIVKNILINNKFPQKYTDIYNFELQENKDLFDYYDNIVLVANKQSNKYPDRLVIDLEKVINRTVTYNNGLVTKVGSGGIHGVVKPGIYKSANGYVIRDFDFGSFYPHLLYRFGFEPEHLPPGLLGKQLIETWFYERNNVYLKNTHYDLNYALKIIMNLCYGLLGSEYGPLLDQKAQLAICINGILLITKMSEIVMLNDAEVLYQNTDGFMIKCKEEDLEKISNLMFDFAKIVDIPLEYEDIDTVWINDVNNYLLKTKKGKVKEKGCFVRYQTLCDHSEYHKDSSAGIIAEALYQYFVNDIPVEQTVYCCNDVFEFCIAAKGGSSFDLLLSSDEFIHNEDGELLESFTFVENKNVHENGQYKFTFVKQSKDINGMIKNEVINQRVIRYYISNTGETLSKFWYEGSKKGLSFTSLEAKNPITILNKIRFKELYKMDENNSVSFFYTKSGKKTFTNRYPNINKEFYIEKANKIIASIIKGEYDNLDENYLQEEDQDREYEII